MVILISGASTGIGRACAVHLARLGHTVWAGVRSSEHFDAVRALNVRGLEPVTLDVTSDRSIREAIHHIGKTSGNLHILVNNAGIAVGGPVEAVAVADWRRQFETNLFGVVALTQAALPLVREAKGRIINMSSISGRIAFPFMGPYAASKFALEAMSDSLRREVKGLGVHVALIEPGAISTPIWNKAREEGLGRVSQLSAEMTSVYGHALDRFRENLDRVINQAAPVSVVVNAVEHAALSSRPRLRYPVGKGIQFSALISKLLPDSILDSVLRR